MFRCGRVCQWREAGGPPALYQSIQLKIIVVRYLARMTGFKQDRAAPPYEQWSRRSFLRVGAAASAGLLLPGAHEQTMVFRPEDFGAVGDGRTNDTLAFGALSTAVNAAGGGIIELRGVTYLIGAQRRTPGSALWAFEPLPVLDLRGCARPVEIRGNGARLRCAPGLRFGTFDASTGSATRHELPFYGRHEQSTPYGAMILIRECRGPVLIENIELDGNLAEQRVGGPYGNAGWQIPASGIMLADNRGDEIIRNVWSHHHLLDGLIIDGDDDPAVARSVQRSISQLRAEHNGRQGCSIVGGRGYRFSDCQFDHTGTAGLVSSPGAGVDIEAEGDKQVRDLSFNRCRFENNAGGGMVADSGDGADAEFTDCRFVGTISWAVWPRKPGLRFTRCEIVGAIVNAFGGDIGVATRFVDCRFTDDPALSPTGQVYLENDNGTIANMSTERGMRFDQCRFDLTHRAVLPWSTGAIYTDCTMRQRNQARSYPRGTYVGRSTIVGNAELSGSRVDGEVVLNGRMFRSGIIP